MKKFWKWMRKKGYCIYSEIKNRYYTICEMEDFTKQMLIGYMYEYIKERLKTIKFENSVIEEYTEIDIAYACFDKDHYKSLSKIIENLEG
jgi:hypothetical protein